MRPIPYGKSSYSNIMARNFAIIDKTRYLELIENDPSQLLLFVRPRRFGKSLFIDSLKCYFDINHSNHFDELFKDTYIHDHKTAMQGKCYILGFDFSGINQDPNAIKASFTAKIKQGLLRFAQNYCELKILLQSMLEKANAEPALLLNQALLAIKQALRQKLLLLLIDEYDLLTEPFLFKDPQIFNTIFNQTSFLEDFYSIIKEHCKDLVFKACVCGVSALVINSDPLIANSFKDISHDPQYASMLGFNEQELRSLIATTVAPESFGKCIDEILTTMKDYYLGYCFDNTSNTILFNPTQCLYYLSYLADNKQEPLVIFDSNTVGNSYKLRAILNTCGSKKDLQALMISVINDVAITIPKTRSNHNPVPKELSYAELLKALLDFGYLSLSKDSRHQLCCPNKAMREQFFKYYFNMISDHVDLSFDRNDIIDAAYAKLDEGEIKPLLSYVSQKLTLESSFAIATGFNERCLQVATLMAFIGNTKYKVWAEQEAFGKGRTDLFIEEKEVESPDRRCYLVEFKYLKKSDTNKERIKALADSAKAQLLRYQESETYKHLIRLKKVVAVFTGTELAYFEDF